MIHDDEFLISAAKTEYREAYNAGDVARLLAVFAPEFTDWSEGEPSFYGTDAAAALRLRANDLFRCYRVEMSVIIVKIIVMGGAAMSRGWHKVRLIDKNTGHSTNTVYRYVENWAKANGEWKITFIMSNRELPPRMLPAEDHATARSVPTSGSER